MSDGLAEDMHDKILNAGKDIRKARDTVLMVGNKAHRYHSEEAQHAYVAGFNAGVNWVVSEFKEAFGDEEDL